MTTKPANRTLRYLTSAASWVVLYLVLAKAASLTATSSGAAVWYPPAALTFTLFSRSGWRAFPIAFVARVIAALTLYRWHSAVAVMLLNSLGVTAAYGVGAHLVRRSCGNTLFDTRRSSLTFLLVAAIATPAAAAILGVGPPALADHRSFLAFEHSVASFWVGDACAMASVTPALLYLVCGPPIDLRRAFETRRLLQHAVLVSTTALSIRASLLGTWSTLYLPVVPMLWIASTLGVAGTASALAVLSTTVTGAMYFGPYSAHEVLQAQMMIGCIAGVGLMVASSNLERRRTKIQLQHSEQRFRDIVHTTEEWIWETDERGTITYSNPASHLVVGRPAEDLIGRSITSLVHHDDLPILKPLVHQLVATEKGWVRRTTRVLHADGGTRWVETSATPFVDALTHTRGFRGTARDVTDREVEQERLRAQFAAEKAVVRRLQEVDRRKDELASSITHDLRTPLTSVLGYLEMLVDGDGGQLSPLQHRLLESARRSANHLLGMVGDLVTLGQIDAGALVPHPSHVAVEDLVHHAAKVVYPLTASRHIHLEVAVATTAGALLADREQLDRMLMNIVGNAVKFTPDGGRVRVHATGNDDEVVLIVADSGVGIEPSEIPHLFDRYYRGAGGRAMAAGTGIGLAVVKGIIDAHGGAIEVSSVPHAGTTFLVRLPRAHARAAVHDA